MLMEVAILFSMYLNTNFLYQIPIETKTKNEASVAI